MSRSQLDPYRLRDQGHNVTTLVYEIQNQGHNLNPIVRDIYKIKVTTLNPIV